jgi:hypothetical protein
MSVRDDYDDAPRPSWRPTLAEREPAPPAEPDPTPTGRSGPERQPRASILAGVVVGLGFFAIISPVRELMERAGVDGLDRPWRVLTKVAVVSLWVVAIGLTSSWLNRRANRPPPAPGPPSPESP